MGYNSDKLIVINFLYEELNKKLVDAYGDVILKDIKTTDLCTCISEGTVYHQDSDNPLELYEMVTGNDEIVSIVNVINMLVQNKINSITKEP